MRGESGKGRSGQITMSSGARGGYGLGKEKEEIEGVITSKKVRAHDSTVILQISYYESYSTVRTVWRRKEEEMEEEEDVDPGVFLLLKMVMPIVVVAEEGEEDLTHSWAKILRINKIKK